MFSSTFDEELSDEALLAALDEVCPPPPPPPLQPPLPPPHPTAPCPPARPPPPPAACSVHSAPLQRREEPQPGAAQDQPLPLSSFPRRESCRPVAATQAPIQQPPTLPPRPVSAKERHAASRAGGAATLPAPPSSGARQASPSVPSRGPCRPVTATPPKPQQPPTLPPRPVSAATPAQQSGSRAGGSAATLPAPPSAPRSRVAPPSVTVLTVLHLFSGPANKKEGLKATIVDPNPNPDPNASPSPNPNPDPDPDPNPNPNQGDHRGPCRPLGRPVRQRDGGGGGDRYP